MKRVIRSATQWKVQWCDWGEGDAIMPRYYKEIFDTREEAKKRYDEVCADPNLDNQSLTVVK